MQLQQLVYFLAVSDTLHFTRAAERVHVAQPSLSQQIKALERELGANLFSRARGNIALTDAGEALLPLARRIIADTETATQEVQELVQLRRGQVRLGATPASPPACCRTCCATSTTATRASGWSSRRAAHATWCASWPPAASTSP